MGNLELHRRFNDAFNARDVDGLVGDCDPEIELHSAVTGPGPAVYRGRDGVRSWHSDLQDAYGQDIRIEPGSYFDLGEHTVTFHRLHGRGRQSGADVVVPAAHVIRWRNGRAVYFKGYLEQQEALRDLGVEGSAEPMAP